MVSVLGVHRFASDSGPLWLALNSKKISFFRGLYSAKSCSAATLPETPPIVMASSLDLTLYLVTDSTPAILGSANLFHVVEEAIKGGVTVIGMLIRQ